MGFNPRARVGRDGSVSCCCMPLRAFQSTRPRGARRYRQEQERGQRHVSIHAPAWGATCDGHRAGAVKMVSIHAPAWGATNRRGGIPCREIVSIHAPAWGATAEMPMCLRLAPCFNPRARVGRDLTPAGDIATLTVSIHAPAWGATLWTAYWTPASNSFNPRARVGRDHWARRPGG